MRIRHVLTVALAVAAVALGVIVLWPEDVDEGGGSGDRTTTTRESPPIQLLALGDIATCPSDRDEATSALADRFPDAVIATAGDNVYDSGTPAEWEECFEPSWGRHRERTRPSPGNHDYVTDKGAPYYEYFGERAGPAGLGYYSYDVGQWHAISLNSNCGSAGCAEDSAQVKWLREDLAASGADCTIAYWHHPRFSSGLHGGSENVAPLFDVLYEHHVDVVLWGHDHHYERFAPIDTAGRRDPDRGVQAFIVGTGGAGLYFAPRPSAGTDALNTSTHGLLKLELSADSYSWEFIPVEGQTFTDAGSASCR